MNKKQLTSLLAFVIVVTIFPETKSAFLLPKGETRIVGGVEAVKGELPWIVDLRKPNHLCGGSIINENWIVTAAHCADNNMLDYIVVAGSHDNRIEEEYEQHRRISRAIIHPGYDRGTKENDIAVLKVATPFEFNKWVQPVPLATAGFPPPAICTAAGWGGLGETDFPSNVLMKVDVPYVSDEACRQYYEQILHIKDSMLCAGEGGKDACHGDSGGPLLCKYGSNSYLSGIVSWGMGCARPDYPGVYTEVSYFTEWINSIIRLSN